MRRYSATLILAALSLATPALGAPTAAQQEAVQDAAPAGADLTAGAAGSGFVVSAGDAGGAVAVTLARTWDDDDATAAFNNLAIKFSAPLDKDTGEGNFFLRDGLSGSTAVELSFKRIVPPGAPALDHRRIEDAITRGRERCAAAMVRDDDKKACAAKTLRQLEADRFVLAEESQGLEDTAFLSGPIWLWGLNASVGHDRFNHRNPADFSEQKGERTPWGVSVNGGIMPFRELLYLGGGYEYKRQWVDAKARTLCQPAASGPQECFTGPFGRPVRQDTSDLFGVVRYMNETARLPFGLEVKAAYDFESEVYGAVTSLYFVADEKKALRGGLRAGWQSDDDDPATDDDNFTIGVFVGAAFSVF